MADAEGILLYDTMSGGKRALRTMQPGKCGIYCCGPTVYDASHVGHARAALVPDVLVRLLRHEGLEVTYVRNITDVDDKIIRRANESSVSPTEVSERWTAEYLRDLGDMGMLLPDIQPKVTDHMDDIVSLVKSLVERGYGYESDGDVYFRVAAFLPYGRLSRRKLEDLQAGARVEVNERKEDPADFALWKAAKPGEPAWPSPWGPGRPGWHIECSAMSMRHLGADFDIHCGGRDLVFPHHENELAQSQAANGEDSFAHYWLHNGFVDFAGEKMAKSLGNFFTIREVLGLYHGEVLRFFLLGVHYRRNIDFDVELMCPSCSAEMSQEQQRTRQCDACSATFGERELERHVRFPGLEEADERLAYVYETLLHARRLVDANPDPGQGEVPAAVGTMVSRFSAAMHDDLNTAQGLGELSDGLTEANRLVQSAKGVDKAVRIRTLRRFVDGMREVAAILGVFGREPAEWLRERRDLKAARVGLDIPAVDRRLAERDAARRNKDFAEADRIRDELAAMGVEIRDFAGESSWTL